MLISLRIKNFAIFDDIQISFRKGLNIITGDTGAGKSIIIDAINLLKGAKASTEYIKTGKEQAQIEGVFEIKDTELGAKLNELGIDAEDDLIVNRIISSSGNNRILINGHRVTLNTLGEITSDLLDIFGQHENVNIMEPQSHIAYLDAFGVDPQLIGEVRKAHKDYSVLSSQLSILEQKQSEKNEREEYLKFVCNEIQNANLSPDEEAELENEKSILLNSELLRSTTERSYESLYEADDSVVAALNRISSDFTKTQKYDTGLGEPAELIEKAAVMLQDASYYLRDYIQNIEPNPIKLEEVEQRLQAIHDLKRKYGQSIADILKKKQDYQSELDGLLNLSSDIEKLKEKKDESMLKLKGLCDKLSHKRRNASIKMAVRVESGLQEVGLKDSSFQIRFEDKEISENGSDKIEFYFSANPDEPPKPLSKVASGGEISRIMLVIKTLFDEDTNQTVLIFDEPDTGIGGAVAESVGAKIRKLADKYQVLCITHLAQVAKFADCHFTVRKQFVNNATKIDVDELNDAMRIDELARMMGGVNITEKTIAAARDMLQH